MKVILISWLLFLFQQAFCMKRTISLADGDIRPSKRVNLAPGHLETLPTELVLSILAFNSFNDTISLFMTSKKFLTKIQLLIMDGILFQWLNNIENPQRILVKTAVFLLKLNADPVWMARIISNLDLDPELLLKLTSAFQGMPEDGRWSFCEEFFKSEKLLLDTPKVEGWGSRLNDDVKSIEYLNKVIMPLSHAAPDCILAQIILNYPSPRIIDGTDVYMNVIELLSNSPAKHRVIPIYFSLYTGFRLSRLVANPNNRDVLAMNRLMVSLTDNMLFCFRFTEEQRRTLELLETGNFSKGSFLKLILLRGNFSIESAILNCVAANIWRPEFLPAILELLASYNQGHAPAISAARKVTEIFFGGNYNFEPTNLNDFQLRLANFIAGNCETVPADLAKTSGPLWRP
mgnify:CR=1 FL=1